MRTLIGVSFSLYFALAAFGQAGNGTITGTVSDPAGAVVANAAVEIKNVETGLVYSAVTTNTGNYTVAQLPPEASLLATDSSELSHVVTLRELDDLPLLGIGVANAGSSGIRNPYGLAQLIPGVNYVANSSLVVNGAPNSSEAIRIEGQDMTNHYVNFALQEEQPSADAIQEVAVQTSNYAAEFGTAGGGLFNIVMKSGTNQFHGTGYEYFVNEDLNAAYPFSIDAAGHKVRPRSRRNDYGGTLGGPVWIPRIYNGRDKTFFFFSWEEFLEGVTYNPPLTVPAAAYRNGDFSAISPNGTCSLCASLGVPTGALPSKDGSGNPILANTIYDPLTRNPTTGTAMPFPGNMIPMSRINPIALKIQNLFPAASTGSLVNNATGYFNSQRTTIIPSLKVDHSFSARNKLSFYWHKTFTDSQYSTPYGNADGLPPEIGAYRGTFFHWRVFRLNDDFTLTPTLLLHVGAGYENINAFDDAPYLKFNAAQELGLQGFELNRTFPTIMGMMSSTLGGMQNVGPSGGIQAHTFQERPTFNANLTWVRGKHTYKFGAEAYFQGTVNKPFAVVQLSATTTSPVNSGATALPLTGLNLGGQAIGFGYANFLLGDFAQIEQDAGADYRLGGSQYALFLQDSWKVTRKLTLDYGLRWDYGRVQTDTYGRLPNLGNVPNPSAGGRLGATIYGANCHCSFANNYPYAVGPRLGVAYQVASKTVLRGGFGVVYSFVPDLAGVSPPLAGLNAPGGINAFANISDPGVLPQPFFPNFDPGVYPELPGSISSAPPALDRNAGRPPRQLQWSFGIQREISRNLVVEASYLGNRGAYWTGIVGGNPGLLEQVSPATFASYGLHPYSVVADNQLLSQLITSQAVVQRFNGHPPLPYAGFNGTLLQALQPYPQFSGAGNFFGPWSLTNAPNGDTWYNALQAKTTKRFSHGLQAGATFTWSKALQSKVEDFWNPASSVKTLQLTDQPFRLNVNFLYTVPKLLAGTSKILSQVVRDWQFGGFLQYGSGFPLAPPTSFTVNNLGTLEGTSGYQFRVPGVPLYNKDLNCHCINAYTDQVLNPAAWQLAPAGTFGPASYFSDFRGFRRPLEDFNIGRNFRLKERMSLQIRAEFVNIFNRTYLGNPATTFAFPQLPLSHNALGQVTGGFGSINETAPVGSFPTATGVFPPPQLASLPRTGTLIARFTF